MWTCVCVCFDTWICPNISMYIMLQNINIATQQSKQNVYIHIYTYISKTSCIYSNPHIYIQKSYMYIYIYIYVCILQRSNHGRNWLRQSSKHKMSDFEKSTFHAHCGTSHLEIAPVDRLTVGDVIQQRRQRLVQVRMCMHTCVCMRAYVCVKERVRVCAYLKYMLANEKICQYIYMHVQT